jgi:hypothetical protein
MMWKSNNNIRLKYEAGLQVWKTLMIDGGGGGGGGCCGGVDDDNVNISWA